MAEDAAPRVQFVIGGVQKGGTTAMAHCLVQHPHVRLPRDKEGHLFDLPDFDDAWSRADIDRHYASRFDDDDPALAYGDATPIYCLHPVFVARLARYNPALRWVVLLRHPVERAISQYHMEHVRGHDRWPLLPALALERWRLRAHHDDFSADSPLRVHSYRLRGDYAPQIDVLYRHFDRSQVLLLRSQDFLQHPEAVLSQVYAYLQLPGPVRVPENTHLFAGAYTMPSRRSLTWRVASRLLRPQMRALATRHGIHFD